MAGAKDTVSIRARDKTTGKDLILRVPRNASMREVMEEYTRKFNELEGKSMSTEEFRCDERLMTQQAHYISLAGLYLTAKLWSAIPV